MLKSRKTCKNLITAHGFTLVFGKLIRWVYKILNLEPESNEIKTYRFRKTILMDVILVYQIYSIVF